mmetsp:Transcript_40067/g.29568  ORF Transcript_40067/g.29568 Transcript_40067/m.29568 type:complete len:80 (+) Transcript_40067:253-492(+)|eukprot:CAMPEP_0202978682 /NCGR_PEP_ID=MMETSP1396-20130829/85030_1 /ASSEMBLY_ACC=CAM_ASM_000872 /TAXON_ID= /ORGANISM="Pseudokeronopsis sp., Strain Brazil" /LENGTH=79 /DNA_ID=CAMNT_0049717749 /DNA_START=2080 /DNA_END=2319 /DNA_ORIENTATION=-
MGLSEVIEEYVSARAVEKGPIDMEIIDRIKSLRSKSREGGDALNRRREETIKSIQMQWNREFRNSMGAIEGKDQEHNEL